MWTHLKYTKLTNLDFIILSTDSYQWFCSSCLSNIFSFNTIEDDFEYMSCLYNFSHYNKMNSGLIKNSQQLQLTTQFKPWQSDIDPNKSVYNEFNNISCSYYLQSEIIVIVSETINNLNNNNFSLLHLNARSLSKMLTISIFIYILCYLNLE